MTIYYILLFIISHCFSIMPCQYCNASNRVPGLYLILEVKSGDSIRGEGGLFEGGLINFAPKGGKFLQVLPKNSCF